MRSVKAEAARLPVLMAVLTAITAVFTSGLSWASTSGTGDAGAATAKTVWLCQPGQSNDPCAANLNATSVASNGATKLVPTTPKRSSKFDCFFVYPTVSEQLTDNSNLKVQKTEIDAAIDEASRFSQVCNVWSPMYRQRTSISLTKGLGGDPHADTVAYDSLLSGWKDYLAHYNHHRPFVLIGHSQGAAMLIRLLRNQIDPDKALRSRLVSAIILGGNVQVPIGKTVGGSFEHIPTCTSARQTGCVIAYSTFGSQPPATSLFGRPGQGVSLQSNQTATAGQQVACVNPAGFGPSASPLTPYFLSLAAPVAGVKVTTPWVTFPDLYTATCTSSQGATWLQIDAAAIAGDPRPKVTASLGPDWGYHVDDVSLALGNLVFDVAIEESAFK